MAATLRSVVRVIKGAFRPEFARTSNAFRALHVSAVQFDIKSDFTAAQERLNTLSDDPGNEAKLKIYALFKQATTGQATGSRPGMMDFVKRAKWDAWNALGSISQEDAMKQYVGVVTELAGSAPAAASVETSATSAGTDDVTLTREGKYNVIRLNRPNKKNALKLEMYNAIADLFEQAAKDDSSLAVLTGSGDYYCSGNDLSNFMQADMTNLSAFAEQGAEVLQRFVGSFIDFPKPLIAVVNGPAVGISVTTLALCDMVYATDKATFNTPFSMLGQTPEGCSSYMFPKIMGQSKANEMLMFERKLTAQEANERGLVTKVFADATFQDTVWADIKTLSELPPETMRYSKLLMRGRESEVLHSVNAAECRRLVERWQSQECMNAIMAFFSNKSKM